MQDKEKHGNCCTVCLIWFRFTCMLSWGNDSPQMQFKSVHMIVLRKWYVSIIPTEISCVMNNELKLQTDWLRA